MSETRSLRDRFSVEDLNDLVEEKDSEVKQGEVILRIPKHAIYSGKQVRKKFNQQTINELGISLEVNGQEQPIIVYPMDGKGYLIQKGERRWRGALSNDNVTHLDCVVREKGDIFGQLIENIQREDLDPIELGEAFEEAKKEHNLDNSQLAQRLGKSNTYVSKFINAAKAPQFILDAYDNDLLGDAETINELRKAATDNPESVKQLLQEGRVISRSEAKEFKKTISADSIASSAKNKDKPQDKAQKATAKQKVTSIAVRVGERNGLVFASGKHEDKLTVLFDDGELEQVPVGNIQLVGYRV